jgi:hypothetical protein
MKKDDVPTIVGVPLHTARDIMKDPARASGTGFEYREMSITKFVAGIPARTSNPELAMVFLLDAIEKFSAAARELDVAEFDASEMAGVVAGADWKQVGFEINSIVREHLDWVRAQADTPDLPANNQPANNQEKPLQEKIDQLHSLLMRHDFSQPLPPDVQALQQEVDPTGAILGYYQRGSAPAH